MKSGETVRIESMTTCHPRASLSALGLGGLLALVATSALAQTPAARIEQISGLIEPVQNINNGDVAWMLTATALVLLMTVPGLALFYGGLVRSKNMLSTLTQVFAIVATACIVWVIIGYSLAFTSGGGMNAVIGGFTKMFLSGINYEAKAATFSTNQYIPEFVYVAFQMTFAAITPALIVGAFAERMKFSALLAFMVLWMIFIYAPIAHMVWYWAGPDAVAKAAFIAEALRNAPGGLAQAAAAYLEATKADSGYLYRLGALDFAGGTVVHINAGLAGLIGCLILGKRIGYGKELLAPHSLTLAMVGAALLWVGWFGFNAGSNLEANGVAALAMINTFVATAAAGLSWMFVEWIVKGKPSLLGLISGVVAGLVAVTPASGFAGPMGSIVLGLVAGAVCFSFCTAIKNKFGYDDTLDVFGIHAVGGVIGALGTGILVVKAFGGTGYVDYTTCKAALYPATAGAIPDLATLTQKIQLTFSGCQSTDDGVWKHLWIQAQAVIITLLWTGIGSFLLFKLIDIVIGLRVAPDTEREGLDLAEHGERAYNP
jgi:Amt family ammonium transporter